MASSSGGEAVAQPINDSEKAIALNFQRELNLLTEQQPPISKERINQIVRIALKEIRNYKHVVYYVENFIKNCSAEYKIPGLYVIDAIIRNCKSQQAMSKHQKEIYTVRFSKNICKTFTHLYSKSSELIREKITRVLQLWQKYSIFDVELIDRLNRIASAASIDSAVNGSLTSSATKSSKEAHNLKKFKRLQYLQEKLQKIHSNKVNASETEKVTEEIEKLRKQLLASSSKLNPSDHKESHVNTTTSEINKLLNDENDDDSYSDSELLPMSPNKRSKKSHKQNSTLNSSLNGSGGDTSGLNLTGSERLNTSITNCTVWLQQEELNNSLKADASKLFNSPSKKAINLPDMTQPPPPLLMSNYKGNGKPPLPPLPPLPVDALKTAGSGLSDLKKSSNLNGYNEVSSTSDNIIKTPKERERDRVRRGLPNIREKHICICSKTLWLGHLAKCTTEDFVIDELTELLSPSSSNDSDSRRNRNSAANRAKNTDKIIVDCQIIPPRGCAYVEFIDRRTASKCLERMKDGYRLEGNSIKVAWATNKGISKDRQIKVFWNVEVGCTFVPWSELILIGNAVDFIKWAEGGLVDEESIPPSHIALFKSQMLKLANSDDASKLKKSSNTDNKEHDMEIDTDPQIPTQTSSISAASIYPDQHMINPILAHQSLSLPPPPPPPHPPSAPMPIALSDMQKQILNHLRTNQPGIQGKTQQFLPGHLPPNLHDSLPHFQQINPTNNPPNAANQQMPPGQFPQTLDHHLINNQQIINNQQHHQRPQVLPQQYVMHLPNPAHPSHPHIPQHYQLVQRPVIIPNQQHLGPKPGGVNNEILANILANVNGANSSGTIQSGQVAHDQIQLMQQLAHQQQSQNQQQQQRINMQIQRNMMGMVGQPLAGQHMIQNPAMIQFIQQQHRQQQAQMMAGGFQLQANQEVKMNSPPVSSTTTDEPPVQSNTAQPKSLMEMSFPPPTGLSNTDQSFINDTEINDHEKLEEKDERNKHGMYDNRHNYDRRNNNDYYDRRTNEYDRNYDRNNRRSRDHFDSRYERDSRQPRDDYKRHRGDYQRHDYHNHKLPVRPEPTEKPQNGHYEHPNLKPEEITETKIANPLETPLKKNDEETSLIKTIEKEAVHIKTIENEAVHIKKIEEEASKIKTIEAEAKVEPEVFSQNPTDLCSKPQADPINGDSLPNPASTTETYPKD